MELGKVRPLPLDGPDAPSQDTLPHDGENEREYIMSEKIESLKQKTLIRKRPLLTMAFTVIAFILSKILGIEADLGTYIDVADGLQLGELILGTGGVIAAYFWDRKNAPKPSNG